MYSSEDLERFYFQYKTEFLPLEMSIETFCLRNRVPYNIFSKWYKDTRKKVVEVQVIYFDSERNFIRQGFDTITSFSEGFSPYSHRLVYQ